MTLLLVLAFAAALFAGCGSKNANGGDTVGGNDSGTATGADTSDNTGAGSIDNSEETGADLAEESPYNYAEGKFELNADGYPTESMSTSCP